MQPNSFFLLLGDHSCCWGSSARWVRCLSSASVWSFFMDHSYFPPGKGRIICIVWIIHTLILQTFLLCPARACAQTHTHTHTLPFAVMNYVHTVYSLINWRCRLRQKRLHKAIPLLFSTSVHSLHMEMNCSSSAPTKSSAADSLTGLRQNTTSRKSLMNKETGWAAWGLFSSLCVV